MPKLSLVIPTYNRAKPLIDSLECAFEQSLTDFEILVIDQTKKHEDSTLAFLEKNQSRFRWIKSDVASLTKARNIGIGESKAQFIVFIDDDVTFGKEFLANHLQALENGHDLVGGRVLEANSRVTKHSAWINKLGQFSGGDACVTSGPTNMATGCNLSFNRRVLEKVVGFDENFQGNATHEDTDFSHRVWKAGFDCYFSAEAELFHHKEQTGGVRVFNLYLNESVIRNKIYFYKKNFPWFVSVFQNARLMLKGVRHYFKTYARASRDARKMLNANPSR